MSPSASQFPSHPGLSVPEAASLLGVNPARVRAMIAAGVIEGVKIGGRWVVNVESVERRREACVKTGRPFSSRRAWGLIFLASGVRPYWLSPSEVSRLRRRLRDGSIEDVVPRLRTRAMVHALRAHPSDLPRIAEEGRIVRGGGSAALRYGADLAPSADALDAYVPAALFPRLRKKYALQPSASPNVVLRVVEGVWPFEKGAAFAPSVVVGVDLIESLDARLQRAGRALLKGPR